MRSIAAVVVCALLMGGIGSCASTQHAVDANAVPVDLILHNGRIVTVDRAFSVQSAMAVHAGRVMGLGSDAQMLRHRGPDTTVIDLKGKTVMPGLIDSHTHPAGASVYEFDHRIADMRTVADVLAYVKQRAATVPAGAWIVMQQVFITRLAERRYPTRSEFDSVAPNHPVFFRTGPDASLNSLALRKLKLTKDTPDAPGSKIERDADGSPTGILRGWKHLVSIPASGRTPSEQQRADRLKQLFADYNRVGITSIADRSCSEGSARLYEQLLARGELTVRIAMSRYVGTTGKLDDVLTKIDAVAAERWFLEGSPRLYTVGIKTFLDGGMLTGSAFMRRPWGRSRIYSIDDPNYRGIRFIDADRLEAVVERAVDHGLQFTAHSVGDGAVHALIEAYEKVNAQKPIGPTRPCITHCNFMSVEAIKRMAELGIVADIQPPWLYLDAGTLEAQFGRERLRWFQPLKSLFEAGVIAGGGSDHMQKIGAMRAVNPYHPFWGMWITMSRTAHRFDGRLYAQEALTRQQAIRFYTTNNAYILKSDRDVGSLEPNRAADFIVIDRDILSCPLDAVKDIRVLQTYLAGRCVYDAAQDGESR